jgi:hypothetical protein
MTHDPYPLKNIRGDLIPWLSDFLRGLREAERQGMTIDRSRANLTKLGRALREAQEATMTPEDWARQDREVAELIDQQRQKNQAERARLELDQALDRHQVPRQAPEPGEGTPDLLSPELDAGLVHGQGVTSARGDGKAPVRNEKIDPITEYLAHDQDDKHDWS